MADLRERFQTADRLIAPDLWPMVEERLDPAAPDRSLRSVGSIERARPTTTRKLLTIAAAFLIVALAFGWLLRSIARTEPIPVVQPPVSVFAPIHGWIAYSDGDSMQLMAADPTGGLPRVPCSQVRAIRLSGGSKRHRVGARWRSSLSPGWSCRRAGWRGDAGDSFQDAGGQSHVRFDGNVLAGWASDLVHGIRRVLAGGRSRRWTSAGDRIREGKPGLLLRMVSGRGSHRIRHAGKARLGDRHDGVGWQRSACASRSVGPNGRRTCAVGVVTGWFDACLLAESHMLRREPRRDRCRPGRRHWFRLITPNDGSWGPSWSPDGQRIAFVRDGRIFTVAPDGTDVHKVPRALRWDSPSDGIPPDSPARLGGGST